MLADAMQGASGPVASPHKGFQVRDAPRVARNSGKFNKMQLNERIESSPVASIGGDIGIAHPRRTNHEYKLAEELHRAGVGFFLPMQSEMRWQGQGKYRQRRRVYRRILHGMIFIGEGVRGRDVAEQNRRINGYQSTPKSYQPKLRSELSRLEPLCAEESTPFSSLTKGAAVVVVGGSLVGREGTIETRIEKPNKPVRFNVRLQEKFGGSYVVEIDAEKLELRD